MRSPSSAAATSVSSSPAAPNPASGKAPTAAKPGATSRSGLPSGDLGRIALAVSPIDPDVLYANAAATEDNSGFYRSPDRGETWVRMSDYIVVDPQYYGELYPDPHRMDRVYAVDVIIHVTNDGGRTFDQVNTRFKHVDNHEIIFDPDDPDYMLVGSDGGLYETFDGTRTWRYVSGNMPLMQFYRVGIDNMSPFYTVYGGTQDNSSVGGPSRTDNVHGIRNSDWFITHGGDGFQARVDPDDPNIVYTQSQYAGIVRYDRASGEELDIQPQPEAGEGALRWHWDSPLIISPHNSRRIYFAAQKLFRSDDRAETWTAVSGDLSRGLDRNQRPVMGRIWPPEAVWKNVFTSPYGTIVALDESPLVEGLLYVGTDDGLVQVSEDGGGSWRRHEAFPAVPAMILRGRRGGVPAHGRPGLRRLQQPQGGRLRAVRRAQRRPGCELDEHHGGRARRAVELDAHGGPRRGGPALPGHRVRALRDA